jgi:hypothetical protein
VAFRWIFTKIKQLFHWIFTKKYQLFHWIFTNLLCKSLFFSTFAALFLQKHTKNTIFCLQKHTKNYAV